MASRYEVEVTISSAKDLKNVNWRHGNLKPYAVVWVDSGNKCSTRVADNDDVETSYNWDETLVLPLHRPIDSESTLCVDIVHASAEEDTKPLIGSARLKLREIIDDYGQGERVNRKLQLKRPSGRPQGKLEVKVTVREPRYPAPGSYNTPPYGVPRNYGQEYSAPPTPYAQPYGAPPPNPYVAAPPSGYPDIRQSVPAPYGQPSYGQVSYGQPSYGQVSYGEGSAAYGYGREEKKSKFGGMGTGLAVGAVGGILGGLALAEGIDALEDKIADDVEEQIYDDDDEF